MKKIFEIKLGTSEELGGEFWVFLKDLIDEGQSLRLDEYYNDTTTAFIKDKKIFIFSTEEKQGENGPEIIYSLDETEDISDLFFLPCVAMEVERKMQAKLLEEMREVMEDRVRKEINESINSIVKEKQNFLGSLELKKRKLEREIKALEEEVERIYSSIKK